MSLSKGDVFWCKNSNFPNEPAHPHIVVEITTDKKIVYVWTSSQIKTVKYWCKKFEKNDKGKPLKTYVEADTVDCSALDRKSAINCNNAEIIEEYVLTRREGYKKDENNCKISNELLGKIRVGIFCSERVSFEIRKLLK